MDGQIRFESGYEWMGKFEKGDKQKKALENLFIFSSFTF